MNSITKAVVALGFAGAMSLGRSKPGAGAGILFLGSRSLGCCWRPWHRRYYRNYAYDPYWYGGPRVYARPYWRHRHWHRW